MSTCGETKVLKLKIPLEEMDLIVEALMTAPKKECVKCTGTFVYLLWLNDKVVYVGQSVEPFCRVRAHRRDKRFTHISMLDVPTEMVDEVEISMIVSLCPSYNTRNTTTELLREEVTE